MDVSSTVTIITITRNLLLAHRTDSFKRCVESVRNQTYAPIEHLIIDGASTDGTLELLKEYSEKGFIKYLSKLDKGIYDAMNNGVKAANGKYIAFLNSDDYYHKPDGIEKSVLMLEAAGADFSYAPVVNLDQKTDFREVLIPDISRVFFTITPNHQTMFVRKDALIKEGLFNTKYSYVADYDLIVRLCLGGYRSVFVPESFVTYQLGGFSLEGTNNGLTFNEVTDIYYENYRKLCFVTKEDCRKICGDIYSGNYADIPEKLARKLRCVYTYFDYAKWKKDNTQLNKLVIKWKGFLRRKAKRCASMLKMPNRVKQIAKKILNL